MAKKYKTTIIDKDFHDLVSNKSLLHQVAEKYLDELIDNLIIGIVLSVHKNKKTNVLDLDLDMPIKEENHKPCFDIFGNYNFKKKYDCLCLKCDRIVGASGFAPHLEKCMGMGRSRSRNASRRIANNSRERESSSYGSVPSDDEDDMDWSSGDKRKKKKERNGNKKVKGTPKKMNESDSDITVDIEGEAEDLLNLRDLLRDYSRGPSPADSVSSSGSTKRRDRPKSKKKREKSSPTSSNLI